MTSENAWLATCSKISFFFQGPANHQILQTLSKSTSGQLSVWVEIDSLELLYMQPLLDLWEFVQIYGNFSILAFPSLCSYISHPPLDFQNRARLSLRLSMLYTLMLYTSFALFSRGFIFPPIGLLFLSKGVVAYSCVLNSTENGDGLEMVLARFRVQSTAVRWSLADLTYGALGHSRTPPVSRMSEPPTYRPSHQLALLLDSHEQISHFREFQQIGLYKNAIQFS